MRKATPLLIAASAFLFLGATCVTKVEQKGPAGPWTGEAVNIGTEEMGGISASAYIVDADGKEVGPRATEFCPSTLLPDEKGYFIASEIPPGRLNDPSRPIRPPLAFSRLETSASPRHLATGLSFRVLQAYPEHQAIMVEMRNDSANTYSHFSACAVLFSPSGEVKEITASRPFPGVTFPPGEVRTFPFQFDSSIDGSFVFGLDAGFGSYLNTVLPSEAFEFGAYKIVETENGRELWGVGEIENSSATDLEHAVYEIYLSTSPTVRFSATSGLYGSDFHVNPPESLSLAGDGLIPAGKKAPVRFYLPLDENDQPTIEVAGIEAGISDLTKPPEYFAIPVSNVKKERIGADSVKVTARISNPTEEHMMVASFCFNLRGTNNKLVGNSCVIVPWGLKPGASLTASGLVTELAPSRSLEIIAYGFKGTPITPPT